MSDKKKLHHMQHHEKIIVMNVIKFFDEEKALNRPTLPFAFSVKRAAAATGVSESTIKRLRKLATEIDDSEISLDPKKRIRAKKILIDDEHICRIRHKIAEFYIDKKEIPSLRKLLHLLKEEIKYEGGREHLRKLLLDIGFKFKKCVDKRQIMLERSDIVAARSRFLRKLKVNDDLEELRKPVIYLDETYIGPSLTVSKNHQVKDSNVSEEYRWVIVYTGIRNSFLPGNVLIYNARSKVGEPHDNDDTTSINNWLQEKIIPMLSESSIIISANLPYYNTAQQSLPPPSAKKQDLQEWLGRNKIKFESDMRNAELYELIQQNKPKTKHFTDELFTSRGHEVLRIPPYHSDLNPVEYVWKVLRQHAVIDRKIFKSAEDIAKLVEDALQIIKQEDWYKQVWNVKNLEWQYWHRDALMEEEITRLGMMTEDSDVGPSSDED